MRKRILAYRRGIDVLLAANNKDADWDMIKREHLIKISFFQHERLVHLIVTLAFAVFELLSLVLVYTYCDAATLLLLGLFFLLLVPYVIHYYILENEVQRMYVQYDAICELISEEK